MQALVSMMVMMMMMMMTMMLMLMMVMMMMIMMLMLMMIVMIRNHIFAGTGLLSVGSKLPGTVSPASRPSHAERTAAGPHEGTHCQSLTVVRIVMIPMMMMMMMMMMVMMMM